jgi:hypothetical protein
MNLDVIEGNGKQFKNQTSRMWNVGANSPADLAILMQDNVSCLINGANHELRYNSSDCLDIDSRWRVPELATQSELGLWP